jgi:hypothetical protein
MLRKSGGWESIAVVPASQVFAKHQRSRDINTGWSPEFQGA